MVPLHAGLMTYRSHRTLFHSVAVYGHLAGAPHSPGPESSVSLTFRRLSSPFESGLGGPLPKGDSSLHEKRRICSLLIRALIRGLAREAAALGD